MLNLDFVFSGEVRCHNDEMNSPLACTPITLSSSSLSRASRSSSDAKSRIGGYEGCGGCGASSTKAMLGSGLRDLLSNIGGKGVWEVEDEDDKQTRQQLVASVGAGAASVAAGAAAATIAGAGVGAGVGAAGAAGSVAVCADPCGNLPSLPIIIDKDWSAGGVLWMPGKKEKQLALQMEAEQVLLGQVMQMQAVL